MSKTGLFGFPLEENYNENVEEKEEEIVAPKRNLKRRRKKRLAAPKKNKKWKTMNQIHGSQYVKKSGKIWKNST